MQRIWTIYSRKPIIAEAPWSAAEWAEALRFVELLQAQPGRHPTQGSAIPRALRVPSVKRCLEAQNCHSFRIGDELLGRLRIAGQEVWEVVWWPLLEVAAILLTALYIRDQWVWRRVLWAEVPQRDW